MPLQNRVLPDQSIFADPSRGLLTGNRGIRHDAAQNLVHRWTLKAWICCALEWKGIRRTPMAGRKRNELLFLDEAVALAAGHRPCATCRRPADTAFRAAWAKANLPGNKAPEIDAHLHVHRITQTRHQHLQQADADALPDGTFILFPAQGAIPEPSFQFRAVPCPAPPRNTDPTTNPTILPPTPHLILGPNAFPYTPAGYLPPWPRPTGTVQVMKPAALVAVLKSGLHAQPTPHSCPLLSINIPRGGLGECETPPAGSAERTLWAQRRKWRCATPLRRIQPLPLPASGLKSR